jgi:hypothetical protein
MRLVMVALSTIRKKPLALRSAGCLWNFQVLEYCLGVYWLIWDILRVHLELPLGVDLGWPRSPWNTFRVHLELPLGVDLGWFRTFLRVDLEHPHTQKFRYLLSGTEPAKYMLWKIMVLNCTTKYNEK